MLSNMLMQSSGWKRKNLIEEGMTEEKQEYKKEWRRKSYCLLAVNRSKLYGELIHAFVYMYVF